MNFKKGLLIFLSLLLYVNVVFSQTLLVGKDKVAKVGNKIITLDELKKAQNELNKLSPILNKTYSEKEILQVMIDEEVLKNAIDNDPSLILNENAYKQEMEMLKQQFVMMKKEENPKFEFSDDAFRLYIENEAKITYQEFEQRIKQKVLAQQLIMKRADSQIQALAAKQYPEEKLVNFRRDNLHRFVSPQSVEVKHIFFRTVGPNGAFPDSEKAIIKKRAEDILKRLRVGESFDELCLLNTEDIQSRDVVNPKTGNLDRGYLGEIQISGQVAEVARQQFGEQIFKALFTYKKGSYTAVLESPFGYHIFYIVDNHQERIIPYDEVREQIIYMFKMQEQGEIVQNEYKQLVKELREKATIIYYREDLRP